MKTNCDAPGRFVYHFLGSPSSTMVTCQKTQYMAPFFSEHGTNSKKVVYINLGFQFLKVHGDRLNLP